MNGGHLTRPHTPKRNDPCWCGSSKKYKRCHLDQDAQSLREARAALPEAMARFAENAEREADTRQILRERYGIYVNHVTPVQWNGRKVWAIGSRVYPDNPPNQTFMEFVITVLGGVLGSDWMAEQEALPSDEQHFVRRAYSEHIAWRHREMKRQEQDADGLWSAKPDGWTQSLASLAFDVASLIHSGDLPEKVVQRLRRIDQYQGARYEVAVAAIFARLGCEIEWIDDEAAREGKHPEFYARTGGLTIAVEAKSRHREGVIHQPGGQDDAAARGDVRRLYNRALQKEVGDTPFMIFLDVNAPPSPGVHAFNTQWARDIRGWLPGDDGADGRYRSLCVTNFSPHYSGADIAVAGEYVFVETLATRGQLPDVFRGMLLTALAAYGRLPEFTEDGGLRP